MVTAYLVKGCDAEVIEIENDHEAYLAGFLECMPGEVIIEERIETHYDHLWQKHRASGYDDDTFIIFFSDNYGNLIDAPEE